MKEELLFEECLQQIEERIKTLCTSKEPNSIYEPFNYVMAAGGKRVRPFLTMASAGVISENPEMALDAGLAIEILHNFTLVHDDIMDESKFRRGKPTVHIKWSEPTAILTGDAMVGISYTILDSYRNNKNFADIIACFSRGLIEVCEGQAYDMDFNTKQDVRAEDYLKMIDKKTAKILQTCTTLGGLCAGADETELKALSDYGYNLGIAFQLQDDLLDLTAEQSKLGKKVGQDIVEGKKTLLIIKAKQLATSPTDMELMDIFYKNNGLPESMIPQVKDLMHRLGVIDIVADAADHYFELAVNSLENLKKNKYSEALKWLVYKLSVRNS